MSIPAVKYQVAPMQRSCIVQIYAPIIGALMTPDHRARFDRACEAARLVIEAARDEIAAELGHGGLCPFCAETLPHGDTGCQA